MELKTTFDLPPSELWKLYTEVGWPTYAENPQSLASAIRNSTFVVSAWEGERLVGLARCLSDQEAVLYLRDILVAPSHRGLGLGKKLVQMCLQQFPKPTQCILLSDRCPDRAAFHRSLGFERVEAFQKDSVAAFVLQR